MPYGPGTYGSKVGRPPKKYKKGKKVVGTAAPGKPYYSSEELGKGFEQTLPAATAVEGYKEGFLGSLSPNAAILGTTTDVVDLFRGKEGKLGSRLARKVAKEAGKAKAKKKKSKKKNMGGMVEYKKDGKVRGAGIVKKGVHPAKMVKMKGS